MKKQNKQDNSPKVSQREKFKGQLIIKPFNWTEKQNEFIDLAFNRDSKIIFVKGPAGSSKTLLATYVSLELLNARRISDIMYVRSAVESADSKLGYLPGELDDKLYYYGLPFMDKLEELLNKGDIAALVNDNRIQTFPVNYLRGQSWNSKSIVVDECFAGDTYVVANQGKRTIRSLEEDFKLNKELPLLKTFNEAAKIFEYKKIKRVWSNGEKETICGRAGNRKFFCTPNHKFLARDGWKSAEDIRTGEWVCGHNNNRVQHYVFFNSELKKTQEVFDIEMEDNHNFIISGKGADESGIIAHNCQNLTKKELTTVLTRIGKYSKCFVLADPSQSDINGKSGAFESVCELFSDEGAKAQGIHYFELTEEDIMRSDLCKFLVGRLKFLK